LKSWLPARLAAAAAAVFLVGLIAGTILYVTADEVSEDPGGFENTNAYRHQLQRLGGKALVLYDQFDRWFDSLWQGKALGVTVIWIGTVTALGIVVFARLTAPHDK